MNNNCPGNLPKRRSLRLPGHNYSQPGAYFVTICTDDMQFLFGEIKNGHINLNQFGEIVRTEWLRSSEIRSYVELFDNEFIIMPNHIHGIIRIIDVGSTGPVDRSLKKGPAPGSIGAILGQYKSRTTKIINEIRATPGQSVWQRNYYDRIIRSPKELQDICNYIQNNPYLWEDEKSKQNDNIG